MTAATQDQQRDFARTQFLWLRQVALDDELPGLASRVAVALTVYFNQQTHQAWPAKATLATNLGVDSRTIQRIIGRMLDHGHLVIDGSRRGGRSLTNHYRLRLDHEKIKSLNNNGKTPKGRQECHGIAGNGAFSRKGRQNDPERETNHDRKGRQNCLPNLPSEPTIEPSAGALATALPTGALAPPGSAWTATPENGAPPQAVSRGKSSSLLEALDNWKTNIIRDERGGR